jgi:hypothetical protein
MKKLITLLFIVPGLVLAMIVATSCTKEGAQGPKGEDGINGTDGTATCGQCHNDSQVLTAKINQWEHSTHAIGGNYERNGGECAICHTSQGFLGYNVDGSYDPEAEGAMISNPNPINCYTCHNIHSDYVVDDYAFTVTEAAELRNTGGTTFDFGYGNMCATCHQGRTVDPMPVVGGPDITFTTTRYGVHHGPQGNTVAGMGLFEPGSYNAHAHSNIENTCVTCHMAEPYGAQAGGHTFFMGYEYHGGIELNLAGCITCHTDEDNLLENTEELQTEIAGLLVDLKLLLDAAEITEEGSDSSIGGTYTPEVAGACLNYKAITEDRSLGVHNPTYIKKLLEGSIALLH